jgi:hypothetical protein
MRPAETKAILERYPEFFEYLKEHKGPIIPIQFGFECSEGWFTILDELMSSIQHHIKSENSNRDYRFKHKFPIWLQRKAFRVRSKRKLLIKFMRWVAMKFPRGVEHMPPIMITQIKEKFGGLCFYYHGGDNYIDGLVSLAESLSYRTCEICGSTKDVGMTQGWLRAVCKSCYETDEWCKDRKWTLGTFNVYRGAAEHMQKELEKQKKNGRKGSKKKKP